MTSFSQSELLLVLFLGSLMVPNLYGETFQCDASDGLTPAKGCQSVSSPEEQYSKESNEPFSVDSEGKKKTKTPLDAGSKWKSCGEEKVKCENILDCNNNCGPGYFCDSRIGSCNTCGDKNLACKSDFQCNIVCMNGFYCKVGNDGSTCSECAGDLACTSDEDCSRCGSGFHCEEAKKCHQGKYFKDPEQKK